MIFVEDCSKWSSLQHSFVLAKGSKKSRLEETDSARGETRRKIGEKSKGRIHTEETKKKISESNIGRHNTDIAKQKISLGNSEKKTVKANMKKTQQKHGKAVRAVAPDGSWKDYNTILDAATDIGMNAGSISNNLKSKGVCNNGYTFSEIPKLF